MGNTLPGATVRTTRRRRILTVSAVAPLFILSAVFGTVNPSTADDVTVVEPSVAIQVEETEQDGQEAPETSSASVQSDSQLAQPADSADVDEVPDAAQHDTSDALAPNSSDEQSVDTGSPAMEDEQNRGSSSLTTDDQSTDTDPQSYSRAARATSGFVECEPGVVYSLQDNGKIVKYDGSSTSFVDEMAIDGISSWGSAGWSGENKYKELNGLAVTPTGDMYANVIKQVKSGSFVPPVDTVAIFYYHDGSWTTYSFYLFDFDSQSTSVKENELIFGAFNKDDQRYYFGGYKKINNVWNIQIYAFNAASASSAPTLVGTLPVAEPKNTNGDMAFDSEGNLFLVTGPTNDPKYRVITITKSTLKAANGGPLEYTSTQTMNLPASFDSGFGGLAFDAKGRMYLGAHNKIVQADPSTGKLLGNGTDPYGNVVKPTSSSDLASCGFPPTITLRKDLPEGRINTSDQFDLTLYQPGTNGSASNNIYGQARTKGSAPGVQAEQVGPLPIHVPGTYKFGEQMASGSVSGLGDYSKSYDCVQNGKSIGEGSLDSGEASITVDYDPLKPANVVCTITNRKTPPVATVDLTLTKKGLPGESLLEGATFQLWLDDGNGTFDNGDPDKEIKGVVSTDDQGLIVWERLDPGKYWVEEIAAPNGYYIFEDNPVLVDLSEGKNLSIEVNNWKLGSVAWMKVDGDNNALLAGSEWELKGPDSNTAVTVTDCVTDELTCPDDSLDRDPAAGKFKIIDLAWGNYQLIERKAPAGYQLDPSEHSFAIGAKTVDYVFKEGFVNEQTTYDASLIKKDADTEQVLSGATFQLYEDTNNNGEFDSVDQLIADSLKTSGADGMITWTGLSVGTYFAVETAAPAGYQLLSDPVVIVVPQETVVEVPNEKSVVPGLPLTGGLGSDVFVVGGGLFAGFGVVLLGLIWRQRKRAVA